MNIVSLLPRLPEILVSVGLSAVFSLSATQSVYAQTVDPEWPCIQQLVAEVSPAVMWPIPVDEQMMSEWAKNATVRSLAEKLGDLPEFTEAEHLQISQFAEGLAEAEREYQLTLLAAGTVEVTNSVRRNYIRGIKRFTRQQIEISHQIEASLNQLSLLEGSTDNNSVEKSAEILETLRWHERVYDQREKTMRLLCEQPVELEQRLNEVLRDAAQFLP